MALPLPTHDVTRRCSPSRLASRVATQRHLHRRVGGGSFLDIVRYLGAPRSDVEHAKTPAGFRAGVGEDGRCAATYGAQRQERPNVACSRRRNWSCAPRL